MRETKLSILIPTCNRAELLNEAISSAVDATAHMRGRVEILVSDNDSQDGTKDVMRNYGSLIKPFHHTKKMGMAAHWNFLLRQASGDYILLLSDDDLLLPFGSLDNQLKELDTNPACGLVATSWVEGNPKYKMITQNPSKWGATFKNKMPRMYKAKEALNEMIYKENIFGNPSAVMFRREALPMFPDTWKYAADWAGWIYMLKDGWMAKTIFNIGCVVRVHGDNASKELFKTNQDLKEVLKLRFVAWAYSDAGIFPWLYLFGVTHYRWARRFARKIKDFILARTGN